jgi:hypothetical protein
MSEFKQNQCWVGFCWKKYNKEETGHLDERSEEGAHNRLRLNDI